MTDALKAKLKTLPAEPGVYFHRDADKKIIYIGKAAVLKNRVMSYFQNKHRDPKTRLLVADIADTEWIVAASEAEALFLESEFIKRYKPKYNIDLKDDKNFIYVNIYCVATHQLVEASLGYFINPFISFALGALVLGEHMSPFRIVAMALAAVAVAAQAIALGHVPWIAPTLALSFGLYGYFRKLAPVDALDGLTVETWVLFPITVGLLIFWWMQGTGAFPSPHLGKDALLLGGGPLTAIPLTMFAAGARRIRLTTLGFLQYLSPSITLVLATVFLGEKFTRIDAITFGCVWAALLIVGIEGRVRWYRARAL